MYNYYDISGTLRVYIVIFDYSNYYWLIARERKRFFIYLTENEVISHLITIYAFDYTISGGQMVCSKSYQWFLILTLVDVNTSFK